MVKLLPIMVFSPCGVRLLLGYNSCRNLDSGVGKHFDLECDTCEVERLVTFIFVVAILHHLEFVSYY